MIERHQRLRTRRPGAAAAVWAASRLFCARGTACPSAGGRRWGSVWPATVARIFTHSSTSAWWGGGNNCRSSPGLRRDDVAVVAVQVGGACPWCMRSERGGPPYLHLPTLVRPSSHRRSPRCLAPITTDSPSRRRGYGQAVWLWLRVGVVSQSWLSLSPWLQRLHARARLLLLPVRHGPGFGIDVLAQGLSAHPG